MGRNRTHRVQTRMNDKEYEKFCTAVRKSGLTKEAYLRHLLNGCVPQEQPPMDYFMMMNHLYRIGNNLNQNAVKAHTINVIDVQRYDEVVNEYRAFVKEIQTTILMPRKIEPAWYPVQEVNEVQ